jgi:hypothetical protein
MPYHKDQLPELAPPREAPDLMRGLINQLGPRWKWDKGVNYDAGPVDLRLSNKGLRAIANLGPAELEALAKTDGWQANAQMPIGNAIAKFMAGNKNGIDSYGANIMLPILNGDLTLDAQRNGHDDRYGLQFRKTFR